MTFLQDVYKIKISKSWFKHFLIGLYIYLSSFEFEYLKYLKFCYYSLEFLDYAAKLKVISIAFGR